MSEPSDVEKVGELGKRSSAIFGSADDLDGDSLFQHIVTRLANILPWFGGIVLVASISRAWQSGRHPLFDVQIVFIFIVFLVFFLRRRIPPRWTATALLTALHFVGIVSLISYGLLGGGGAIILVGVGILFGTIYGRRLGIIAAGVICVTFFAVAAGGFQGWWPLFPKGVELYLSAWTSWINIGVDMAVVSIVLILCISAIQERLRSLALMNRAESIFINSVFNAQRDLFLVFDPKDGKPLSWNTAFRQFFGLSDREIEAKRIPDDWMSHLTIQASDLTSAISQLTAGTGHSLEVDMKDRAGNQVPFEFHGSVVELPDDRHVIATVGRDLRERRTAERALRESERRFRLISETMPAVVWTVNHAGQMLYVSPNAIDICGFSAEEIVQDGLKLWMPRIHDDDRQKYKNAFINLMVHHKPSDCQYRFLTKSGRLIWLHERVVPIEGQDDEPAACGVFSDVTDQVNTAERSRQSEKLEVLGQLAGGAAHDFNNQISAIMGLADLLSHDAALAPHLKKRVDEIINCAHHAADLPNQLLTFSRRGSEKNVPVNVHEIINRLVSMISRSFSKSIRCRTLLFAHQPEIPSIASRLENALLNLCLNARDAMPGEGELTLSTENHRISAAEADRLSPAPCDYLFITVTDTGHGMSEETQKHIFEPFFTTKPAGQGTGMGLSQVFGFVKGADGEIEVRSKEGKGTSITLMLPMIQRENISVTSKEAVKKILLVDDDTGVLAMVSSMLQDMGFSVVECRNGRHAVEEFEQRSCEFSLVILDMVMPELDGRETFALLRKLNGDIPILLVSARSDDREIKTVLSRGASGYLPKPFNLRELKDKIDKVMEHRA
jgi:PAS domain S-box-containing protein